ncbi:hypothetical protein DIPPA_14660 [Diplonema papillatum]|nr:hypothetical protein DIPPA_14660 [Diplonema papillatum]
MERYGSISYDQMKVSCASMESDELGIDGCFTRRTVCELAVETPPAKELGRVFGIENLNYHPVDCGAGSALKAWRVVGCEDSSHAQIEFECCRLQPHWSVVTSHTTDCILSSSSYPPSIVREYHPLHNYDLVARCPDNSYMQSFFHATDCPLVDDKVSGWYHLSTRMHYTCISDGDWSTTTPESRCVPYVQDSVAELRRYVCACPLHAQNLGGFSFGRYDCPDIGVFEMRSFRPSCVSSPRYIPRDCYWKETACTSGISGDLTALRLHSVGCFGYGVSMKSFFIIPCAADDSFQFHYQCCTHTDEPVSGYLLLDRIYYSNCGPDTSLRLLADLELKCPPREYLKVFQLEVCPGVPGTWRWRFHCLYEDFTNRFPTNMRTSPCLEDGPMAVLAAHGVVGCNGGFSLNGFLYARHDCAPNERSIKSLCTKGSSYLVPSSTVSKSTQCDGGMLGSPLALLDHTIQCGVDQALAEWQIGTCLTGATATNKDFRVDYKCHNVGTFTAPARTFSTRCAHLHQYAAFELVEHPVKCPDAMFLRSWKYDQCSVTLYRVVFECFPLN